MRTIQIEERAVEIEQLLRKVLEEESNDPKLESDNSEAKLIPLKKKSVGFKLPSEEEVDHDKEGGVPTSAVRSSYSLCDYAGRTIRGIPTSRVDSTTSSTRGLDASSSCTTTTGDCFTPSLSSADPMSQSTDSSHALSHPISSAMNHPLCSTPDDSELSCKSSKATLAQSRLPSGGETNKDAQMQGNLCVEPSNSIQVETSLQPLIMVCYMCNLRLFHNLVQESFRVTLCV